MKKLVRLVTVTLLLGVLCAAGPRPARADITYHCVWVGASGDCGSGTWFADTTCGPGKCFWVDLTALASSFCGCMATNGPNCSDVFNCLVGRGGVIGCYLESGGRSKPGALMAAEDA